MRWLTWPLRNILFLCFSKTLSFFCTMFRIFFHLHWASAVLLITAISLFHWQPKMPMSTSFTHDVVCFGSWAVPVLLHTFPIPSFWYKFTLVSYVQRIWFQNLGGFIRFFLIKSNPAVLFLNINRGLHLVVKVQTPSTYLFTLVY